MTSSDKTILERNFNMNLVVVIALVSCTATFVWKGSEFANKISNQVDMNSRDIATMEKEIKEKADQKDVDNLRVQLEDYSRHVRSQPIR